MKLNDFILRLEQHSIFTHKIALVRTIFAVSAFLVLITNNLHEITNFNLIKQDEILIQRVLFMNHYSIFNLCGIHWGKIISILILLFAITGYYPKISCLLQAWVHISISNSFIIVEGGDQIASNLSLLLIPICLFDNRMNQWDTAKKSKDRKAVNVFFNVYYFLIMLQVAVVYLDASIGKLLNEEWRSGTCLYYWFTHNLFGAPVGLQKVYNIITLSSLAPLFAWLVIIFELCLFACLLVTNKKTKKIFLFLGLIFHLGIAVTHGLISFFLYMAGALILYLDEENVVYHFLRKLYYKIYGIHLQS